MRCAQGNDLATLKLFPNNMNEIEDTAIWLALGVVVGSFIAYALQVRGLPEARTFRYALLWLFTSLLTSGLLALSSKLGEPSYLPPIVGIAMFVFSFWLAKRILRQRRKQ
jgi:hypothetical protein